MAFDPLKYTFEAGLLTQSISFSGEFIVLTLKFLNLINPLADLFI